MSRLKFLGIAVSLLLPLLMSQPASAQYRAQRDSLSVFRATQLIAPAVAIGSGMAIHFAAHDTWDVAVRDKMLEWSAGKPEYTFDNYLQYSTLVINLGLGFTGVRTEHCFLDRAISTVITIAACEVMGEISKEVFRTLRPSGGDYRSFPSGHTSFAFAGAELVRREYGWGWGAGAYGIATTVAFMRMYRNWHWFSDVLAGAGLGILSANIGCWLLEPTKNLLGIKIPEHMQFGIAPSYDPYSGAMGASFALRF